MFSKILNKLLIIGLNPETNHYSVVLDDTGTIPYTEGDDLEALFKMYADTPANWSVIRKQTFVAVDDILYLVYNVVIPKNYRIKTGSWLSISDTDKIRRNAS